MLMCGFCAQSVVGTVIKSGEDEQPIGVASVLNVKRYQDLEAMQQIKAHLIRSCAKSAAKEQFLPVLFGASWLSRLTLEWIEDMALLNLCCKGFPHCGDAHHIVVDPH